MGGLAFVALGRQQDGAGTTGVEGGRQGVAGLQETHLPAEGLIEGRRRPQLGILPEVVLKGLDPTCGLHLAQLAEQLAEAHWRQGDVRRIVGRFCRSQLAAMTTR